MLKIKTPLRLQMHASECAAICVGIILDYFGHYQSHQALRDLCKIGRDGATIAQINDGVSKLGHKIKVTKKGIETLKKLQIPVILHWEQHHFVVLEGINNKYAYINDPALGHYKLSLAQFSYSYTGLCIEIVCEKALKPYKHESILNGYLKEALTTKVVWKLITSSLASASLLLIFFGLLAAYFDYSIEFEQRASGFLFSVLAAFVLCVFFIFDKMKTNIIIALAFEATEKQKRQLINYIAKTANKFQGTYNNELANRVEGFQTFFKNANYLTMNIMSDFQVILIGILAVGSINIAMAIAIFIPSLFTFIADHFINKKQRLLLVKRDNYDDHLYRQASHNLSHYQRFFAMGINQQFAIHTLPSNLQKQRVEFQRLNMVALSETLIKCIDKTQYPLLILLGLHQVIVWHLTFGQVLFSVFVALHTQSILSQLWKTTVFYRESKRFVLDADDFVPILNQTITQKDYQKNAFALNVQNLCYYFSSHSTWLFYGTSIQLMPSQWLCIYGESGTGKTTLLFLLSGQLEKTRGEIQYFGVNINNAKKPGFVFSQQAALFSSLADYFQINNAKTCFADEQISIQKALTIALLNERLSYYINNPNCSTFAQLALTLSEYQQLSIAKAYHFNNDIIFMDEAFSHIESSLAKQIILNLKKQKTTVVLVTHRDDIKQACDLQMKIGG